MSVTVTHVNITSPDMTETTITNWVPVGNWTSKRHEGLVPEGQTTLVAEYNVSVSSGKFLEPQSSGGNGVDVFYFSNGTNSAWEPYYSWQVLDTYYTGANSAYIESSNVKIFYTPPVNVPGLDPDPLNSENGFAGQLHDIRFNYVEGTIGGSTSKLMGVSILKPTISSSETQYITLSSSGTGNATLKVLKENVNGTDYTHSYKFSDNTWVAKASGLQSKLLNFTNEHLKNGMTEAVVMPSANESKTYSVVLTAGTLALEATVPDALGELTFDTVQKVRTTFEPEAETGITVSGSFNTSYRPEMTSTFVKYPFTFIYTKANGSDTMTLDRQPTIEDITGQLQVETIDAELTTAGGTGNVIPLASTDGLKVGMQIQDWNYIKGLRSNSRIPSGAVIASINAGVSVTIKNATTGSAVQAQPISAEKAGLGQERMLFDSDWTYSFEDLAATINEAATIVTATGTLVVTQYGRTSPDGNIKLKPNFITIS